MTCKACDGETYCTGEGPSAAASVGDGESPPSSPKRPGARMGLGIYSVTITKSCYATSSYIVVTRALLLSAPAPSRLFNPLQSSSQSLKIFFSKLRKGCKNKNDKNNTCMLCPYYSFAVNILPHLLWFLRLCMYVYTHIIFSESFERKLHTSWTLLLNLFGLYFLRIEISSYITSVQPQFQ